MKTMTKLFRVESALKEVERAEDFARQIIHEAYPEGSPIQWQKFRGLHSGIVVRNSQAGRGDQFYVRNDVTGKEYWISFYDVKMAMDV